MWYHADCSEVPNATFPDPFHTVSNTCSRPLKKLKKKWIQIGKLSLWKLKIDSKYALRKFKHKSEFVFIVFINFYAVIFLVLIFERWF